MIQTVWVSSGGSQPAVASTPPRDSRQCLRHFWLSQQGLGGLLASSGWRPGALAHVLRRTAQTLVRAKPGGSSGQREVPGQSRRLRPPHSPVTGLKDMRSRWGQGDGGEGCVRLTHTQASSEPALPIPSGTGSEQPRCSVILTTTLLVNSKSGSFQLVTCPCPHESSQQPMTAPTLRGDCPRPGVTTGQSFRPQGLSPRGTRPPREPQTLPSLWGWAPHPGSGAPEDGTPTQRALSQQRCPRQGTGPGKQVDSQAAGRRPPENASRS